MNEQFRKDAEKELAQKIRPILKNSAPKFDFKRVADAALSSGLVSRAEADRIARQGHFPEWLAKRVAPRRRRALLAEPDALTEMEIFPDEVITRDPPTAYHVHETLPPRFDIPSFELSAVRAFSGTDTTFYLGNFGRVTWKDDKIISPLTTPAGEVLHWMLREKKPVSLEGNTFVGVAEGGANYTHWLNDVMPRLVLLEDKGVPLSSFDNFIFATIAYSYHRETLAALGIDTAKVFTRTRHGPLFHTERFTRVSHPRRGFVGRPRTLALLAERFGVPRDSSRAKRRLFVSRTKATSRRILNEDELAAMLERHGFELVAFEELNIAQTAAVMAEASHVVAPHGAGMANAMFMPPGAKVVELYSAHITPEGFTLSQQCGHDYYLYQALKPDRTPVTEAEREQMTTFQRNSLDMVVPVDEFETFLSKNGVF